MFVGNFAARLFFSADSLSDIRDSDTLDMASLAVDVSAAVYAILVVRHITSRQAQRVERLERIPPFRGCGGSAQPGCDGARQSETQLPSATLTAVIFNASRTVAGWRLPVRD